MRTQGRVSIALGLVLIIGMTACAASSRIILTGNPDLPAAQGEMKLSTSNDGNTRIDLEVKHLASPERVNPGATVYLVWVRPLDPGANAVSLGALVVNEKLDGALSAVTPLRAFDLFITAETSQAAAEPLGKELLTARVQMGRKG